MILKPGMKHQGEELYKVYINHDLGMTLTYLQQGQHRSPMYLNGEIVKMSFEGKNLKGKGKWTEHL